MTTPQLLDYPFTPRLISRKKRAIRRELLEGEYSIEKRIAILGGSTTSEIKDVLELFLLNSGIRPTFYESGYDRYYEELMFDDGGLAEFGPDIIYFHTTNKNLSRYPGLDDDQKAVDDLFESETQRFESMWNRAAEQFDCAVIQNNMEAPFERPLGNLDTVDVRGRSHFTRRINQYFSERAADLKHLHINDIEYLSASLGLNTWHDRRLWYTAKYAVSFEAIPHLAHNLAGIIGTLCGVAKKCLVLDLDNTLWGGVIGDDGLEGIQLGRETAEAEAFSDFQEYASQLRKRGVILAVCSKNEEENAKQGFSHPDSVLSLNDFSAFKANWNRKDENIEAIASEINIGVDSLVFIDDNYAERELVSSQLPAVAVPNVGSEISGFINVLDRGAFFETLSLSKEDVQRSEYYAANAQRKKIESRFSNYDEFLASLEMSAVIKPFEPVYLDRITQLTNKTNQFNLTTRRYTQSEIESMAGDSSFITLYGKLTDKFGDNGLVSLIIARVAGDALEVDTWLMSCRVLKRGMEMAMFDYLVAAAMDRGLKTIVGEYIRTAKNDMVSDHYGRLGFENTEPEKEGTSIWVYDLLADRADLNKAIAVER